MNTVREIQKLNRLEAEQGITGSSSWHHQFKDTAWVYVGGLPYQMTEGDVLCMFSQVGEIEKLDMRRDPKTGKFMGFCFIKYEDQRSTILAVDNFTGVTFMDRIIKVDHKYYTPPKKRRRDDMDSSEDEAEERKLEEMKTTQNVSWENEEYRKKANLEPKEKKQKLSKEEKKAKKERKLQRQEKRERKEQRRKEREAREGSIRDDRKDSSRRDDYRKEERRDDRRESSRDDWSRDRNPSSRDSYKDERRDRRTRY